MKKYLSLCLFLLILTSANAQYKKASFLKAPGRTWRMGVGGMQNNTGTSGIIPSVVLGFSAETEKLRTLYCEVEIIAPIPIKFQARNESFGNFPQPVYTLTGNTGVGAAVKLGQLFRFTKKDSEQKFIPIAKIGLFALLPVTDYSKFTKQDGTETEGQYLAGNIPEKMFAAGIEVGLGFHYNFTKKSGIEVSGNYKRISNLLPFTDSNEFPFKPIKSNLFINVLYKITINTDAD